MPASAAREVMHTVVLAMAVMAFTGTAAIAQTNSGLAGVSEAGIYVTLPIYITSLLVVGGGSFTLGRWTANVHRDMLEVVNKQTRAAASAEARADQLASRIAELEARIERATSSTDSTD
jgi:choline-glycine betaine transporter